ncbi:hypothetical protein DPX39_060069600 [Trypanosoma brucei equiperdum]|uniref:Variant surface glycoprotein n=1 Tax=Trypanosoma brucei equiperdum TaxID=630700 RepID=A0A3L6L933_9TRYP|nr:hypothetical protein DPX39_060081800 [Trypanosoma brucei equiperdum]RHW72071.1 hypothetical protein DPX39_060075600 [Trypanosoma brucei equiperdum]RHW72114.1 hypothetical protein DPX39_060063500 [Trypanosoma brucei equiperdum]RHW72142.1 hypothetical protein DPX39_060069600 [Trypanosoma brucei equiperdum]
MRELKSAIVFAAAQNTDNSMRAQAVIPLAAARTGASGLTNKLRTCITKGSDLQRKLATLASIHLGLTKLTNLEATAVDEGQTVGNGAADNSKVYQTTTLKKFVDTECQNTLATAAKGSETDIDLKDLRTIKTYKLQQKTGGSNPIKICGIKVRSINTKKRRRASK